MEFRGTKGEWSFEEEYCKKYNQPTLKVDSTFGIEGICTVWSGSEEIRPETVADARLICASKDLLEACMEFVRKVEAGEARSTRSYAQMKKAILKALGE